MQYLKIVTNWHQYTKNTEDEKFIFWINAHTPIEKQSNQDWNATIHWMNNCPHIKVPSIFCFLIIFFYLCFYHQLWVKWVCIRIIVPDKLIHDSQNICGYLTLNEMHIKFTSLIIFLINGNFTETSSGPPPEEKKQYCI